MPKNTKIIRLQRRVADCERKVDAAPDWFSRQHRVKILNQRRKILARATRPGPQWNETYKLKPTGAAGSDRLVAARINMRSAQ